MEIARLDSEGDDFWLFIYSFFFWTFGLLRRGFAGPSGAVADEGNNERSKDTVEVVLSRVV